MNKQIIVRVVITFIFVAFSLRVLIPVLYDFFKLKLSGQNNQNDIDWMIKKQKEQLKAQYRIGPSLPAHSTDSNVNANDNLSKDILKHISNHYSYTLNEKKITAFLMLAEKRKLLNFLSEKNQRSPANKINFLSQALLLFLLSDEVVKKTFTMSQVLAKKLSLSLFEFTMGVQIKILLHMKASLRTEEQVFSENYDLQNFSGENIAAALDTIIQKEADLWAQGPSLLFEELSLHFHYASIVRPLPPLRNKNDSKTAALILGCLETDSLENIKKKYKKLSLEKHPDKITAQKLPPKLEKKGIENFNRIQEAFEILNQAKK